MATEHDEDDVKKCTCCGSTNLDSSYYHGYCHNTGFQEADVYYCRDCGEHWSE